MAGIWSKLGDFGLAAIERLQEAGRSLGEALHILKPIAPDIEPMAAARDWGAVSTHDALEPEVLAVLEDELIPRDLYVARDVPWQGRFAYEVSTYGRDLTTGRFARWKYNLTTARELTIQEVQDEAERVIGKRGRSPQLDIWSMKVTGAWRSAEVEW